MRAEPTFDWWIKNDPSFQSLLNMGFHENIFNLPAIGIRAALGDTVETINVSGECHVVENNWWILYVLVVRGLSNRVLSLA